jgi:hypothetical protein
MLPAVPRAPLFGVRMNVDVTMNCSVALSPNGLPVAVTVWMPPRAFDLTVKLHVPMLPPETEHVKVVGPVQMLLVPSGNVAPASSATNVSDVLQPDPDTVTTVVVGPTLGEKISLATETVKGCEIGPCCTYCPVGSLMVTEYRP